jgi:YD repeat-containing protein
MSNVIAQIDAMNNVTNFEYDEFNRLVKTIYPLENPTATSRLFETMEYDVVGNVKKRTDTDNRSALYNRQP